MARLNEVPAPAAESLESIKRRFIRQNREIARVNSNQSIRIRNLETEISRLLAENIAIREDAINARAQADKWKAAHRLNKEVLRVKEQLEERLLEVNNLVGELGALPDRIARRSSQRRRRDGLVSELVKPPEEREPRQRRTILEPEGTLPVIVEDKSYPRRTLDLGEIDKIRDDAAVDSLESPDLGPPPVAYFDDPEAPLAFNNAESPNRMSEEEKKESETANGPTYTTLESKRKRRTSILLPSPTFNEASTQKPEVTETTAPKFEKSNTAVRPQSILKTGAKRKLEVSELEDTSKVSKELDDFIFQRKASAATTTIRPSRFSRPLGRQSQENTSVIQAQSPGKLEQPARRILAPKSANSPAKRKVESVFDKHSTEKDESTDAKPERRLVSRVRSRPTVIEIPAPDERSSIPAKKGSTQELEDQAQLHPKTPAADTDDVLSPVSTEPSTRQMLAREMAVTNSVEDVLNGSIGRGSRRARAAVNYAQPKLNTKMRRPGKELVGAIEGITRAVEPTQTHHRNNGMDSISGDIEQIPGTENFMKAKKDVGQLTGGESPRWNDFRTAQGGKSEPTSPLRDKKAPVGRRSDHHDEELSIAASRLSVFDPPTSSPVLEKVGNPDEASAPSVQVSRSRRQTMQSVTSQDKTLGNTSLGILRSRRPNSTLGLKQPEPSLTGEVTFAKGHAKKSASVSSLPSTNQLEARSPSTGKVAAASSDTVDLSDQRARTSALTRRRSMMV